MQQRAGNAGKTRTGSAATPTFFTRAFARASFAVKSFFQRSLLDEWRERRSARKTETINSLAERARKGELEAVKKLAEMSDDGNNKEVVEAFKSAGALAFSQLVELLADKKYAGTARVLLILCCETSIFAVENALDELVGLERLGGRDVLQLVRLEGVLSCIRDDLATRRKVRQLEREKAGRQQRTRGSEAGEQGSPESEEKRGLTVHFEHDDKNEMDIALEPDAEFSARLERSDRLSEQLARSDREELRRELGVAIGLLGDEAYAKSASIRICALAGQEECRSLVLMMLEQAVRTPPNERVKKAAANLLLQLSRYDEEKH